MGAKQGRAKGNEQQSRVQEPGRKARETRPERKGKPRKARAKTGTGKAAVRQNREEVERKNRGLVVRTRNRDGRKEVKTEGVRKRKGSGASRGMDGPEKVGNESGRQG